MSAHLIRIFAAAAFIFTASYASAQDAPGTEWRRIDTAHFTIVYPREIDEDAKRVADTLEKAYPSVRSTIGTGTVNRTRTTLILHTQYADSNGFATFYMRRMEWYNTPPQLSFGGPSDWYQTLSVHEFRHICQFDSLNTGLVAGLSFALGDLGQAIGIALVPAWYYEGDSVLTETVYSNTGRGRKAAFDAELRALLLDGKRYSYYKAMLGSYSDYDPLESPYLLGYHMTAQIRKERSWRDVERVKYFRSWIPIIPYSWDLASFFRLDDFPSAFYERSMDEITRRSRQQLEGLTLTAGTAVVPVEDDVWTANRNPRYLDDSTIAVVRSSLYDPYEIVTYSDRKKTGIETTYPSERLISAGAGLVVWAEEIPDKRWTMKSSSDIFTADAASKSARRITHGGRFYAPAISADGKRIAAVEFTETNRCSLVILDALSGHELSRIAASPGEFFQTPCFTPDGSKIVCTSLERGKGNALKIMTLADGSSKAITPFTWDSISQPVSDGTSVFYSSDYSGIDNIYALNLDDGRRFQVTSRSFGAYSPTISPDGKKLAFSDLTSGGYQIVEAPIDRASWTPFEKVEVRKAYAFEPVAYKEEAADIFAQVPETPKKESPYIAIVGGFTPYQWLPWVDTTTHTASIAAAAGDYLSTTSLMVGGTWNYNEKTASGQAAVSYLGAYPVLTLSGIYGNRYSTYTRNDETEIYSWFEKTAEASVSLPFNFSRGLTTRTLTLGVSAGYRVISDKTWDEPYIDVQNDGAYMPVKYFLSFVNADVWSSDIKPRWGQTIDLSYTHTPRKLDYATSLVSARGVFYFPGIFRRNSLYIEGGCEKTGKMDRPLLESNILFPRGYSEQRFEILSKASVNYTFPLFYPENHPGWLLGLGYIKQVYANLFYDHGYCAASFIASSSDTSPRADGPKYFRSAGAEIVAEWLPFCYQLPIHIGFGRVYLFDPENEKKDGGHWSYSMVLQIASPL